MKRHEIWLNNSRITDIDPSLWVSDIEESTPDESSQVYDMGYANSTRFLRTRRTKLTVKATIIIRDRNQIDRTEIYTRVQTWAKNGGYLMTSDRDRKRLYCEYVAIPSLGSILRWTNSFTITFTAYANPFWEDYPTVKTFATDDSATGTMRVHGNAEDAFVDAYVTAVGGEVNTLTISVGTTGMAFTGLSLAVGSTLAIVRGANGLLSIAVGATSKMINRTAASADFLKIQQGVSAAVSFSANVTCDVVLKSRGRWL